ncbi:MAG: hypothetical protein RIA63_15775, partial [Cyclobacteriaceae bacterium]
MITTITSLAQEKVLELPVGDILVSSFLYDADSDGYVCFVASGRIRGTAKSKTAIYLMKHDSLLKEFAGFDHFEIWSMTSTSEAFHVLVQNPLEEFEMHTIYKDDQSIQIKGLTALADTEGKPLTCLDEKGTFYLINYVKEKGERSFIVTTLNATGHIQSKKFESKIPFVDKKLKKVPGLADVNPDRHLSMIECAQQKKFMKKGDFVHFFIEGFDYNLGEVYDLTEVYSMNLKTGESSFRTIPDE